jgi:geranylgeranyl diphosphate synthase type II
MSAEAAGGPIENAIPAAVAVEMIHAYSLIHDDLPAMDNDDLRRGRPTCHIQFDEATAILAGDALLARAFEVLTSDAKTLGLPAEWIVDANQTLAQAAGATGLVGGQSDDLAGQQEASDPINSNGTGPLEQLESIHRRKTGALFAASLELGAICVGAEPAIRQALRDYADAFGLAFQIVDDLLDYTGTSEEVGKRTGKDIELGKLTFPGLLGVDASRARAAELTATAIEAVALLGTGGHRLIPMVQFVLQRSR